MENIWAQLETRFGVRGIYVSPFPHFSYLVFREYDSDPLEKFLREYARDMKPFHVKTGGLGLFTGDRPVIFIPVVRSPGLTGLHLALWENLCPTAAGVVSHYHPGQWMPHITLAQGDVTPENLPGIMAFLNEQDFNREIKITDLSIIQGGGKKQILKRRFCFN